VRLGDFVVVITLYGGRSVSVAGMMFNGCFCSTACLFASLLRDGCTVRTDQWDSADEKRVVEAGRSMKIRNTYPSTSSRIAGVLQHMLWFVTRNFQKIKVDIQERKE